jgi:hypothetical protein
LDETEERLYDAIPHNYEQPADTPDIIPQSNVSQNRFYEMVKRRGTILPPVIFFKLSSHNVSHFPLPCQHLLFIGACGV